MRDSRALLSTMKTAVLVLTVLLLATNRACASELFGAKLLRVVPQNHGQLTHLHQMLLHSPYDFWREPRDIGSPVDIMATMDELQELTDTLESQGLKVEEQISDVGKMVVERTSAVYARAGPQVMEWTDFHDYDTMNKWLVSLASDYPEICTLEPVGKSYEGRTMNLLTVGKGLPEQPGIFIEGGMHGREWLSPATVTYMIYKLVTNSSDYDDLLSNVNFYFMPIINPDGYQFTFINITNRLWRKSRSDTGAKNKEHGKCMGVDPNRNWGHHWNEGEGGKNPCFDAFAGYEPFSEVEVRVVRDQILRLGSSLKMYLSYHSYGQFLMYPWGYTHVFPDDWEELASLAQDAVKAITNVYGSHYSVGSPNAIFQRGLPGGSIDWVKAEGNVKYCYTIEVRDEGEDCFGPNATEIIPNGEENFQGLLFLANFVKNTYANISNSL